MPIYEYRCDKGHVLEVMQRMSAGPLEACTECGASVQRVFHPIAVHFKGSGFYNTDYGKAKNNKGSKDGKGEPSESGSSSDSKSDSSSSDSKSPDSTSSDSKSSGSSETKTSKASASSD